MSTYFLYKITNNINGREYVGVTNNFNRRMAEHKSLKTNKNLAEELSLYGVSNFTFNKMLESSKDYVLDMEYAYLSKYIIIDNMYNSSTGGHLNGGTFGEKHGHTTLNDSIIIEMRKLHNIDNNLYSINILADKYNLEPSSVAKILRGDTWNHLNPISIIKEVKPSGRKNTPRDKLNMEDARYIRKLYATGNYTYQDIADMFNNKVKKLAVGKIVRNERWRE